MRHRGVRGGGRDNSAHCVAHSTGHCAAEPGSDARGGEPASSAPANRWASLVAAPPRSRRAALAEEAGQLRDAGDGAKLDVTLPVTYCILDSCPTTLEVSLVWQPDGKPTRDSSSARIDTDSCHFTVIRQSSNATAIVTGFVSDGTSNLASGQTSGTVTEGRERLVGFGDPAVCLS